MTLTYLLVTFCVLFWCFEFGFCARRYSGRDRILLFNNDIFFGPSKMPNRYNFRYLTDGRQYREEAGYTVRRGAESIMKVRGKFYYTGDDGRVYETVYEADENGYRPISRIVGGAKYPYPERFPPPLPDLPIGPDDDDLADLTPFGTEYSSGKTPNRGKTRIQRPRPASRPTSTSTTTPFPDDDNKLDQFDEGDEYDYPTNGNGEKRDTKNQNKEGEDITEEPSGDSSTTDSYSSAPSTNHNQSAEAADSDKPATHYQPPPKNENKPARRKSQPPRKSQSGTVEQNDEFFDTLFGS